MKTTILGLLAAVLLWAALGILGAQAALWPLLVTLAQTLVK